MLPEIRCPGCGQVVDDDDTSRDVSGRSWHPACLATDAGTLRHDALASRLASLEHERDALRALIERSSGSEPSY